MLLALQAGQLAHQLQDRLPKLVVAPLAVAATAAAPAAVGNLGGRPHSPGPFQLPSPLPSDSAAAEAAGGPFRQVLGSAEDIVRGCFQPQEVHHLQLQQQVHKAGVCDVAGPSALTKLQQRVYASSPQEQLACESDMQFTAAVAAARNGFAEGPVAETAGVASARAALAAAADKGVTVEMTLVAATAPEGAKMATAVEEATPRRDIAATSGEGKGGIGAAEGAVTAQSEGPV